VVVAAVVVPMAPAVVAVVWVILVVQDRLKLALLPSLLLRH
jgi:hypothetical protein